MPAAALDRLGGGEWNSASLKGKRTLVNFWATWCGPCKQELAHLQKLYDKIKGRSDVSVVTLNVDYNAALVEPFIHENEYTFPVVLAGDFWDSLDVPKGIPTNWIVDEGGVVRFESQGFGGDPSEGWVEDTIARLQPSPSETTSEPN